MPTPWLLHPDPRRERLGAPDDRCPCRNETADGPVYRSEAFAEDLPPEPAPPAVRPPRPRPAWAFTSRTR